MLKKNDRKVLVDWHDGTFGPEGDNVFQLLFRLEGQHAQAEFSAVSKQHLSAPARAGMAVSSERCSACGLRIG